MQAPQVSKLHVNPARGKEDFGRRKTPGASQQQEINQRIGADNKSNQNPSQHQQQQQNAAQFRSQGRQQAAAAATATTPAAAAASAANAKTTDSTLPSGVGSGGAKIDSDLLNVANENRVILNVGGIRHETYKVN